VDLQATYNITRVKLNWEAAYGKSYQIQVSPDTTNWATVYSTTTGAGGVQDLTGLSGTGRYVRMYGTARGTSYGYSLWEFEVYGTVPVPTGLTATAGNTQVSLSWNASPGATSYNVYRATTTGGPYTLISTAGTVTETGYVDSTVANGTTYYYVLTGTNPYGESGKSSEAAATPICAPPAAPTAGNNGPVYQGMTLNLTASAVAGASYSWSGPNGFSSTAQNPSIVNATIAASGTYSVTATVGSCISVPGTTTVTVNLPVVVAIGTSGTNVILNWPGGTLQSATNLAGDWDDVGGATPPFAVTPSAAQRFYRIRLQ
jgi:hypothetical protein